MRQILKGFTIISMILIGSTSVTLTSDTDPPKLINDGLSPTEMHRILGESKAAATDRYMKRLAESRTAAKYNQTDYDVTYYNIDMNIDIFAGYVIGAIGMNTRAQVDGLDSLEVDFMDGMTVDSVYNSDGLLNYNHADNKIYVALDKIYNTNELIEVTFAYHGFPNASDGQGLYFYNNNQGDRVAYSLSEPMMARSWWPCKDRPDDKADSLDIFITCDTGYFCASNGTLIDTVRNGDGSWTFSYQSRYPITTYLFSVAISNYSIWTAWYYYNENDSMPIIHHVYPHLLSQSLLKWSMTDDAIGIFAERFGEYPFINEKYGHAMTEMGGAMEHQTVTSVTSGPFGFNEGLVVHELAHMWWGDLITCNNWHETWLNEGFASYGEAIYFEAKWGHAYYHSYMGGMRYTGGGSIYIEDTTSAWGMFATIVYNKGAWVLHMLRRIVGDATFFGILQTYYGSVHRYSDATTEDFKNICESVSGMELDYFFDEWIYGTYYPRYDWSYATLYDADIDKYNTYLNIRQYQSTDPLVFTMPIDIVFDYGSYNYDTVVVFNDVRESLYVFQSDIEPVALELDPQSWILRYSNNSTWPLEIIPDDLDDATQYYAYIDSVIILGGNNNRFSILSGALPDGLELDSLNGYITGYPSEFGQFSFEVRALDISYNNADTAAYELTVIENNGLAGDVDLSGTVNMLDVTFLIAYLYKGGSAPANPVQADPDNSCAINILDVTYLINFLYKAGPAPLWGCAEL